MFHDTFSKVMIGTIALILLVAMILVGSLDSVIGAVVAGIVTLIVYGLIYIFRNPLLAFLDWAYGPAMVMVVAGMVLWVLVELSVWFFNFALVPLGGAYVVLVAGVLAGNPASVGIAAVFGVILLFALVIVAARIIRGR